VFAFVPFPLQLNHVIHNLDLLTGFEWWQANVGACRASESVAQRTAIARARLSLDRKVELVVEVVRTELEYIEVRICFLLPGFIFGLELLCETARAVLAGTAPLARLRLAFEGYVGTC
jgi:hypothetical protein